MAKLIISEGSTTRLHNPCPSFPINKQKYEGAGSGDTGKEFAHEAGYDAYLTGAIFARLRAMAPDVAAVEQATVGRLFNYRSMFGLNLLGGDPRTHAKDHVFHLGIAPAAKAVKTDDLMVRMGVGARV